MKEGKGVVTEGCLGPYTKLLRKIPKTLPDRFVTENQARSAMNQDPYLASPAII